MFRRKKKPLCYGAKFNSTKFNQQVYAYLVVTRLRILADGKERKGFRGSMKHPILI
jgi:hypothetical protein